MARSDAVDALGMFDAIVGLPEQVADSVALAEGVSGLPTHESVANVVLLGMGDDGGAADLVAAVVAPYSPVPVVISESFQLPSFVGEDTLVVAFSWSGEGSEVLDAAQLAADAGAHLLSVAAPGALCDLARASGGTAVQIASTAPVARAAIGALTVPALVAFERMGIFPGATEWIGLAVEQLTRRRDALLAAGAPHDGPPALVARSIGRTFPLVVGAGDLGAVAGRRWKASINQNAKVPAWTNAAPGLCYDELAGFGQHGDVTRQVLTLVTLRHDHEHPQVADRLGAVAAVLDEVVAGVCEVQAEGEGELAQLLDLFLVGDLVSLALAAHEGVDPGPTASLDRLRAAIDA